MNSRNTDAAWKFDSPLGRSRKTPSPDMDRESALSEMEQNPLLRPSSNPGLQAHFAFAFHGSQLEVQTWHDLLFYQSLVKEANTDLPWTAGDITVLEDGLKVVFRHKSSDNHQNLAVEAIKGWFRKRSESDPDYVFAFYKTFLEILPFHHNLQPDDIARRLLHHFNMRQESASWQNNEGEWAFGDVWVEDGDPRVEFTHISNPDTQKNALKAISQWHFEKKQEDYDVEWEMDSPYPV